MPQQKPGKRKQRRYEALDVLAYIVAFQQRHPGRSPSQRRIQRDLKISVPSVAHLILHRLERDGLLTITRYGRGQLSDLALTEAGRSAVQRRQEERQAATGEGSAEEEQDDHLRRA